MLINNESGELKRAVFYELLSEWNASIPAILMEPTNEKESLNLFHNLQDMDNWNGVNNAEVTAVNKSLKECCWEKSVHSTIVNWPQLLVQSFRGWEAPRPLEGQLEAPTAA